MNEITNLRDFIQQKGLVGMQTFRCRNIVGDPMINIYDKDGIKVDICYLWGYIEIFGLTDEEYNSLSDILDIR